MDSQEIESYKKAGKIAHEMVEHLKKFVKPGMKLIDIADETDKLIGEKDARPAFPINLSLNEVAAHYTPSFDDETIAEGLLKVDLGVEINGCIADTAFSLDLTDDNRFEEMIELNNTVLNKALSNLKPGMFIGTIGNTIQSEVENYNEENEKKFSIVKNLTGHSLDKHIIHAGFVIPNYKNENKTELKDIAFAIEPFLTTGVGEIYDGKPGEIFMIQNERPVRDKDAREILKFIKEEYKTKPFCKRWLVRKNFAKLDFSLRLLVREGILHNFPILVEKSKQPVSQMEHTVLISGDLVEVTTR